MKTFALSFLMVATLWTPLQALATPVMEVESNFPEQITIGTELEVTFVITRTEDTAIHFPDPVQLNKPFRRLAQTVKVIEENPSQFRERHVLTFTPLRVGNKTLKGFEVPYVQGENAATMTTPDLKIPVQSQLSDALNPEFKTPPPPKPIYRRNILLLAIIGAIACVLIAILGTLIAIRIFGPADENKERLEPDRPAHEIALERLNTLEGKVPDYADNLTEFFFELSEVLKYYLANRYGTSANAETSTELLREMELFQPEGLSLDDLRSFVESTDLIKYARSASTEEEAHRGLLICRGIVDSTRQTEQEIQALLEDEGTFEMEDAPLRIRAASFLTDLTCSVLLALIPFTPFFSLTDSLTLMTSVGLFTLGILLRDVAGRSLGQTLMGIRVRTLDGECPTPGIRLTRNLLLSVPFIGWTAAMLWAAMDPCNRRPGDRWTATGAQAEMEQRVPPALLGGLCFTLFAAGIAYWMLCFSDVLGGLLS